MRSAKRLKGLSITEQGAGVFDLKGFFQYMLLNSQRAKPSISPSTMDLRKNSTYFLPFSR